MDYFKLLMIFLCIGAALGYLFLGLIIYILCKDTLERKKASQELNEGAKNGRNSNK